MRYKVLAFGVSIIFTAELGIRSEINVYTAKMKRRFHTGPGNMGQIDSMFEVKSQQGQGTSNRILEEHHSHHRYKVLGACDSQCQAQAEQDRVSSTEDEHYKLKVLPTSDSNYEYKNVQDWTSFAHSYTRNYCLEEYFKPSGSAIYQRDSQCQAPPQQDRASPTEEDLRKLKVLSMTSNSQMISEHGNSQQNLRIEELHEQPASKCEELPEISRFCEYTPRFLKSDVCHKKSDSDMILQGPSGLQDSQSCGYGRKKRCPRALVAIPMILLLLLILLILCFVLVYFVPRTEATTTKAASNTTAASGPTTLASGPTTLASGPTTLASGPTTLPSALTTAASSGTTFNWQQFLNNLFNKLG